MNARHAAKILRFFSGKAKRKPKLLVPSVVQETSEKYSLPSVVHQLIRDRRPAVPIQDSAVVAEGLPSAKPSV